MLRSHCLGVKSTVGHRTFDTGVAGSLICKYLQEMVGPTSRLAEYKKHLSRTNAAIHIVEQDLCSILLWRRLLAGQQISAGEQQIAIVGLIGNRNAGSLYGKILEGDTGMTLLDSLARNAKDLMKQVAKRRILIARMLVEVCRFDDIGLYNFSSC